MSQIFSLFSLPDLNMCAALTSLKIEVTNSKILVSYGFTNAPSGTISIGYNNSYILTLATPNNPTTNTIPEGSTSASLYQGLNADDLNKVWYIVLSLGDQKYSRLICFDTNTQIYPYGTGLYPKNLTELFPEQIHPAYKDRVNTGVCFSGGGARAMIMAMGQMRFLHQYRDKIGYISSVSGGSWASAIYTYAQTNSIDDLLGVPITTTEQYKAQVNQTTVPNMVAGSVSTAETGKGMIAAILLNLLRVIVRENLKHNTKLEASLSSEVKNSNAYKEFQSSLSSLMQYIPYEFTLPANRLWLDAVGLTYFNNNGIYNLLYNRDYFTLDSDSAAQLKDTSGSFSQKLKQMFTTIRTVQQYDNIYQPYLIMNSLMLRPTANKVNSKVPYIGYEYTPLYHGPAHNAKWDGGWWAKTNPFVGGGNAAIHTYGAFGGINAVNNNNTATFFSSDAYSSSLTVASGTSSSAYAGVTNYLVLTEQDILQTISNQIANNEITGDELSQIFQKFITELPNTNLSNSQLEQKQKFAAGLDSSFCNGFLELLKIIFNYIPSITPQSNYFDVQQGQMPQNTEFNYGDAGLSDNFGLMALLRRQVKNIVVFVNTDTALSKNYDGTSAPTSSDIDITLASFFGLVNPSWKNDIQGIQLDNLTVFDSSEFKGLVGQLQDSRDNGMMALTEIPIKGNKFWGIPASKEKVKILWVYNNLPSNWTTEEYAGCPIEEGSDETILTQVLSHNKNFPFLNTFGSTLVGVHPLTINMLSNLTYWSLAQEENQEKLKQVIPF